MNKTNYSHGSILHVRDFGGNEYHVEVINKESDIKNGRSGWDGKVIKTIRGSEWPSEFGKWGYDDQIIAILS